MMLTVLRRCMVAMCFVFTFIVGTFDAHASYFGYGTYKYAIAPSGLKELKSVNFHLETVDYEDSRPLKCLTINDGGSLCEFSFLLVIVQRPLYLFLPEAGVSISELRRAGVKTVGEFLNYLREMKGVNLEKVYEFGPQPGFTFSDVTSSSFCLREGRRGSGDPYQQDLICGLRSVPEILGCDIQEDQISIEHGALSVNALNGHMATGELTVRCDGNGSAKLMAPNPEPKLLLASDGSLFTTISVDGKPLAEGVVVNAGPAGTRVRLTSTLGTVGTPKAGQFSGSMVVVLAKP